MLFCFILFYSIYYFISVCLLHISYDWSLVGERAGLLVPLVEAWDTTILFVQPDVTHILFGSLFLCYRPYPE